MRLLRLPMTIKRYSQMMTQEKIQEIEYLRRRNNENRLNVLIEVEKSTGSLVFNPANQMSSTNTPDDSKVFFLNIINYSKYRKCSNC
jgi:hypothetical protein